MPLTPTQQGIIEGFDVLAGEIGFPVHVIPAPSGIPAAAEYLAELQIGGLYQSVNGAVTLRKDQIPGGKALNPGDLIHFGGAVHRIDHVKTDLADPLVTLAYTTVEGPLPIPATQDESGNIPTIGGGGALDPDPNPTEPSTTNIFWQVHIVQPTNGGTIEIFDMDGDPITSPTIKDGTRIEVRLTPGPNVFIVGWTGDLAEWGSQSNFLHLVKGHLTISAETAANQVIIYTDTPEEGGTFNWQDGHTHTAGQPLNLTFTPADPSHTLLHFQINGDTVTNGQDTPHGTITVDGFNITIPDPRENLTVEAELAPPSSSPTLGGGITGPDPLPLPGESATYEFLIPSGQALSHFLLNGEEVAPDNPGYNPARVTITQPAGNFDLSAVTEAVTYTLDANDTKGTIHISNTSPAYGEQVTLTYTPAPGYTDAGKFYHADVFVDATNNSATWTVTGNATIQVDATFVEYAVAPTGDHLSFNIYDTDPATNPSATPISSPVPMGSEIWVKAVPAPHYEFLTWSDLNTNNPIRHLPDLQDNFMPSATATKIQFSFTDGTGATGTLDIQPDLVPSGDTCTLTFAPNTGNTDAQNFFLDGAHIGAATGNSLTFTPTAGGEITTDSAVAQVSLTIPAPADADLALQNTTLGQPYTSGTPVDHGTQITATLSNFAPGKEFSGWSDDPNNTDNPRTFTLTDSISLTADIQDSTDFQGTYEIQDGQAPAPLAFYNPDIANAQGFTLNISGGLVHNLIHDASSFRMFKDALYGFWQNGWGSDQTLLAYNHPTTWPGGPRTEADKSYAGWWRDSGNGQVDLAETHSGVISAMSIDGTAISIDAREVHLAVEFNSAIGYVPIALIPYLNAGRNFDATAWAPSYFQSNHDDPKTVAQVKDQLEKINDPGTGLVSDYKITQALIDLQEDTAGITEAIRTFNPYTISVDMAAIEAALGVDNTDRLIQVNIGLVSASRSAQSGLIPGANTDRRGTVNGAFQMTINLS